MKKLRVAFDVKGTLVGGGTNVHKLYKWFEDKGCHMIIWSSIYAYAVEAQKRFNYVAEVMPKNDKLNEENLALNPGYNVDIAVDDDNFIEIEEGKLESFLACDHMIAVHEIPDEDCFEEKYGHFFKA